MRPNSLQLKVFKRYSRQKRSVVRAQRAIRMFDREFKNGFNKTDLGAHITNSAAGKSRYYSNRTETHPRLFY